MRYVAPIFIVAIIVVGILIGLIIQRWKNRQSEELDRKRQQLTLRVNQLEVARIALRTIRDLQGDSSFDATIAIDRINQLEDEFFDNHQKGITK